VLGGGLSAIMLKALEDEPAKRYSTVGEFASDLIRYLDGRPVEARAQAGFYRFRSGLISQRVICPHLR
jgi:hypothetical protein